MKKILIYSLGLLGLYFAVGLYLYLKQRTFLYFPTPALKSNYPSMILHQKDVEIYIYILNEGHDNAILYFGGNAESMAESADYIQKQFPDFTVYLMDYRGYGNSSGQPSETALYDDALLLYDSVKKKHKRISIGGRSLGTAIATYVAAHREVSKLALITPFDSIVQVAQGRYPMYPTKLLLHDHYDSLSRVPAIKAKTFIVWAENDSVVTPKRTQALIDAFPKEQLKVEMIKNRGHADISSDPHYYTIMQKFMKEEP